VVDFDLLDGDSQAAFTVLPLDNFSIGASAQDLHQLKILGHMLPLSSKDGCITFVSLS